MQPDVFGHITLILLVMTATLAVFSRLGLPSVLAYLVAGVLVGPEGLRLLSNQEEMKFLSDLGIILMMFMIGLDFSWPKLRRNLKMVMWMGFSCTFFITAAVMLIATQGFGLAWPAAFLIGGAAAMSSTAVVSKQLMDQKEFYDSHGKLAFSVTLFQDFIGIVFLASIPMLTQAGDGMLMMRHLLIAMATIFFALTLIYFGGRKVELAFLRFAGTTRSNEIFILTTLLLIMGAAWFSGLFQMPTLLGVFLAGMIIGETGFRHKVEDDLRPFHDIMIGIFFIVMGMMLKLSALFHHPWVILGLLLGILALKMAITGIIGGLYSRSFGNGLRVGLVLSNCDEFSLILVILGVQAGIIGAAMGDILLIVFILSLMFSTLLILYNKTVTFFILSLLGLQSPEGGEAPEEEDQMTDVTNHIILCGFGETGKNLFNMLKPAGIPLLAIDTDPRNVEHALSLGCRAIYGDATNIRTLKTANLHAARALIITFDSHTPAMKLLQKIRAEHPTLPVLARVHEMDHIEDMMALGATAVFSDGLGISLSMRQEIMRALKLPDDQLQDEDELIKTAFKT